MEAREALRVVLNPGAWQDRLGGVESESLGWRLAISHFHKALGVRAAD